MLSNIDIYSDLDLLKKYAKNVVLTNKKDSFVLVNKNNTEEKYSVNNFVEINTELTSQNVDTYVK